MKADQDDEVFVISSCNREADQIEMIYKSMGKVNRLPVIFRGVVRESETLLACGFRDGQIEIRWRPTGWNNIPYNGEFRRVVDAKGNPMYAVFDGCFANLLELREM